MKRIVRALAALTLTAAVTIVLAATLAEAQTPAAKPETPAATPQAPPSTPGKPGARGRPAPAPATNKKSGAAAETRFRLVLNAAFALTTQGYSDTRTPLAYAEPSTIRASYETGTGIGFDGAFQASFYRGFGVLVGYSYVSRDVTGSVDVSRPHPLYLNRPRTATAELSGYGFTESAADFDLAYARTAGKLDWAIFAGVTLFKVEADLLSAPTFDERYPYDTLVISGTPAAAIEGDTTGFNVRGRLDYRFGRSVGVGVQLRYATGSVTLDPGADASDVTLDAGGFSVGAGVRFYF
jgi:hypothetical protein